MKTLKEIAPFFILLFLWFLLVGCATPKTYPVFPWPDFQIIDIGDMLCAPSEVDKRKFDRWLNLVDDYRVEVEKLR